MATMAEKQRKQLIKTARPLIKEWLKKKKATPPDGSVHGGSEETYVWNIPGLTAETRPVGLTEKGKLFMRLHVERFTLFKGRRISSEVEPLIFDLTDTRVPMATIEKLILALREDLAA